MALTDSQRKEIIDNLREYMFRDIQAAINGKANYLAALGLSTYTENLGGFLNADLERNLGGNYTDYIMKYYPKSYTMLDTQLRNSPLNGGLYKIVRCGLVHEYFMKADSSITAGQPSPNSCGVVYNPSTSPQLIFHVNTFFKHFKEAFQKYYYDLVGIGTKICDPKIQNDFDTAYEKLPLSKVASGTQRASGGWTSTTK